MMTSAEDERGGYLGDMGGAEVPEGQGKRKFLDGEEINGNHPWSTWVQW